MMRPEPHYGQPPDHRAPIAAVVALCTLIGLLFVVTDKVDDEQVATDSTVADDATDDGSGEGSSEDETDENAAGPVTDPAGATDDTAVEDPRTENGDDVEGVEGIEAASSSTPVLRLSVASARLEGSMSQAAAVELTGMLQRMYPADLIDVEGLEVMDSSGSPTESTVGSQPDPVLVAIVGQVSDSALARLVSERLVELQSNMLAFDAGALELTDPTPEQQQLDALTSRATISDSTVSYAEDDWETLAGTLRDWPAPVCFQIGAHSDDLSGSDEENLSLSEKRATFVQTELSRRNVDPNRLEAVGYGVLRPLSPTPSRADRRIEIRVRPESCSSS